MRSSCNFLSLLFCLTLVSGYSQTSGSTTALPAFDKVMIGPHIQVTFIAADKEEVRIEEASVDMGQVEIGVKGSRLHFYLKGAKITSPTIKIEDEKGKRKDPIYKGAVVKATIYYRNLDVAALHGEEEIRFKGLMEMESLRLKIYGESQVVIEEAALEDLRTIIYGESTLDIIAGRISYQKYILYGESIIDVAEVESRRTKVTAYGESEIRVAVTERLKFSALGESSLSYSGTPTFRKGLVIGENQISRF